MELKLDRVLLFHLWLILSSFILYLPKQAIVIASFVFYVPSGYGGKEFDTGAQTIGWALTLLSFVVIPGYAVFAFFFRADDTSTTFLTVSVFLLHYSARGSYFLQMLRAMRISLRHKGKWSAYRLLRHPNSLRIRRKYEPGFTLLRFTFRGLTTYIFLYRTTLL